LSGESRPYPRAFNHVGVAVPDVERAVAWYREVLGFTLISGPNLITSEPPNGLQPLDVLGARFRRMRMAHLVSGNGVGIEFFEAIEPPCRPAADEVSFDRVGIFHLCVTDPDIEGLAERVVQSGGRRLSKVWQERADSSAHRMIYCADPFGIVIEIYTHSYEVMQGWR
jgi:catechol 2,3-dioxygenase-like lactoylglutathione lyase family enzyme